MLEHDPIARAVLNLVRLSTVNETSINVHADQKKLRGVHVVGTFRSRAKGRTASQKHEDRRAAVRALHVVSSKGQL